MEEEEEEEENDEDNDGKRIQGVQAHVPLRPGMKYSRKRKPLTPTSFP